jgi:hypothetical protein
MRTFPCYRSLLFCQSRYHESELRPVDCSCRSWYSPTFSHKKRTNIVETSTACALISHRNALSHHQGCPSQKPASPKQRWPDCQETVVIFANGETQSWNPRCLSTQAPGTGRSQSTTANLLLGSHMALFQSRAQDSVYAVILTT